MTTMIIIAIATALFTVGGIVILAKQRLRSSELKKTIDSNDSAIVTLESEIEALENSIVSESERCVKANNKKIEGIRYARRIQRAAFPQREIGTIFHEYFIFTNPLGIVTGDFFKAVEIKNYKIFALADCAGHGVPGAFLTMLGLSALKESLIKHFNDSDICFADILGEMRQYIKNTLHSNDNSFVNINDGMNMSLCAFDTNNDRIIFAGANHNVYLYSNGQLTSYHGDRMPIGWSFKGDSAFNETSINAQKGDMLYFVTDSLQNQFGGPNDMKFSVKRLTAMLENIATLPIEEQKSTIDTTFNQWTNGRENIDDITVVGLRV